MGAICGQGIGRVLRAGTAALVFLILGPGVGLSHELGTIRVTARFQKGGAYEIDAIVDREHLPPGFGVSVRLDPGLGPVRNLTPGLESRIGGLVAASVNGVRIAFDGSRSVPRVSLVLTEGGEAAAADAAELTLRFSGEVPAGARSFTWSNAVRLGTYMLTIRTEGVEQAARQWVEGPEESVPFVLSSAIVPWTRGQVIRAYLELGYTHILPKGIDHILFVLGIFLLSVRLRSILLQVTAFTVAHTITLALTMYGIVSLPARIVEPLIAFSIVYVAVENIQTAELRPWRVALVFGFGLLHGMGFAGVLSELGLPRAEFVPALLSFNAGVELGQLTVIGGAFVLIGLPFRHRSGYRRRVVIPCSVAIAAVGLYWFVVRATGAS